MSQLLSIQIGRPQTLLPVEGDTSDKPWSTAFYKRPIEGAVRATRLGLEGDGVADPKNHGGPDKAVCVYAAAHWPYWRRRLGLGDEFGGGAFGENFSVGGLTEETVCLGDRWRIGAAEFEVSQPRQPCWKLARRWRQKELALWVQQTGLTGWYVRVVAEGEVRAGDAITLVDRPLAEWPLARANDVMYQGKDDPEATAELAGVALLSASWRDQLKRRLA